MLRCAEDNTVPGSIYCLQSMYARSESESLGIASHTALQHSLARIAMQKMVSMNYGADAATAAAAAAAGRHRTSPLPLTFRITKSLSKSPCHSAPSGLWGGTLSHHSNTRPGGPQAAIGAFILPHRLPSSGAVPSSLMGLLSTLRRRT